jgi:Asp-tRNA(Asn)/Glu-tRNA(Gln) amidotransferase A subunit family amidase
LTDASATELLRLIASGQISPVELTELFLDRIERLDGRLHSFLLLTPELAREQARAAEQAVQRGEALGPCTGCRSRSRTRR